MWRWVVVFEGWPRGRSGLSRSSRFLALAAVTAALATGWMHGGIADARRTNPNDEASRLRAQLAQARQDLSSYQQAYSALADGLDRIERANAKGGRNTTRQVQRQIDRTRRAAEQWVAIAADDAAIVDVRDHRDHRRDNDRDDADGYTAPQVDHGGYGYALAESDFRVLLEQLTNAYASEQPTIVGDAARDAAFTVDQVVRMLKVVSFDSTRVEVAAAVSSRVVDPESWFKVYDAIEYSSNRQALRERVEP